MAGKPQVSTLKPLNQLSHEPVGQGLAWLLEQGWHQVQQQSKRFVRRQRQDPEALHDLRVAMRRLRSLYQAFAPAIAQDDPRPAALRDLFRQTNPLRDREAAIERLAMLPQPLPWLQARWQRQLDEQRIDLQGLPDALLELADAPANALGETPYESLGGLAAARLQRQQKGFCRQLKGLHRRWREAEIHRLRIRAKRLRYLLEPFAEQQLPCAAAVKQLKELQDRIGAYRDSQLLHATLRRLRKKGGNTEQRRELKQAGRALKKHIKKQRRRLNKALDRQSPALQEGLQRAIASLE